MNVRPITSGVLLLFVLSACDYPGVCYDRVLDGCRKAEDLAAFVAEQAAGSLASGNAIIGESGVLQATGKMSVSIRAHGVARSAPQLQGTMLRTDGVATSSTFRTEDGSAMSMSADFAVGGLRGFRAGESRVRLRLPRTSRFQASVVAASRDQAGADARQRSDGAASDMLPHAR